MIRQSSRTPDEVPDPGSTAPDADAGRRRKKKPAGPLTIGEAARLLGVSTSTLRLWENIGLVTPGRTKGGFRLYSSENIAILRRIKRLKAVEHLNVHGIKRALRKKPEIDHSGPARNIGLMLRLIRYRKGMSLNEAADLAGLTAGYLSAIERSQVNAPYRAIQKLATAYGTSVLALYHIPEHNSRLVRSDDRKFMSVFPGYRLEMLSVGAKALECMIFRVEPGAGSNRAYAHEGEEFVYVLSGTFEIWLNETEQYTMNEGDSFWYDSNQGHRWQNPSKRQEAVVLWVVAPSGA